VIGAGEIARRYARAVFGLSEGAQAHAKLLDEVGTLANEITSSDELRHVLLAPLHPRAERKGVLVELATKLGLSAEVRVTSELLVDENRLQLLPAIRDELQRLVDSEAGRVAARVVSARPLDRAAQEEIRQALARRVGHDVAIEFVVEPELIGGVVARIGDVLLDGSIRTQLERLGETLKKGTAT
jgi:F-type H+-transporting ATPase subunit delta